MYEQYPISLLIYLLFHFLLALVEADIQVFLCSGPSCQQCRHYYCSTLWRNHRCAKVFISNGMLKSACLWDYLHYFIFSHSANLSVRVCYCRLRLWAPKICFYWYHVFMSSQDINFWGSVYPTYYAIPHLRKSRGTIVVNASVAAYTTIPRKCVYSVCVYIPILEDLVS